MMKEFLIHYKVSKGGKVFSVDYNWRGYGKRELKQNLNSGGYPSVRLTHGNERRNFQVHKLVAFLFLPPRPSFEYEIRHLDGNKSNNHFSNLAWGTKQQNSDDRERHGHTSRGLKHAIAIKNGLKKRGYNVKF